MSWNYRCVRTWIKPADGSKEEAFYEVNEVFYKYSKRGNRLPWGQSEAIQLKGFESKKDIIETLEMMISDLKRQPIFDEKKERMYLPPWGNIMAAPRKSNPSDKQSKE